MSVNPVKHFPGLPHVWVSTQTRNDHRQNAWRSGVGQLELVGVSTAAHDKSIGYEYDRTQLNWAGHRGRNGQGHPALQAQISRSIPASGLGVHLRRNDGPRRSVGQLSGVQPLLQLPTQLTFWNRGDSVRQVEAQILWDKLRHSHRPLSSYSETKTLWITWEKTDQLIFWAVSDMEILWHTDINGVTLGKYLYQLQRRHHRPIT